MTTMMEMISNDNNKMVRYYIRCRVMVMMIIFIILVMVTMIIDQEWSRLESTGGCSEEGGDGGQEEAAQVDDHDGLERKRS